MSPTRWIQVRELLHAAMQTPACEREALLDRECAADPGLRSQVAALLQASEQPDVIIDAPVLTPLPSDETLTSPGTPPARARTSAKGALSPGTIVRNYEIDGPIGEGGMGAVYRARDTQLRRDVAIKVLHSETARHPEHRRRFLQEARSASALNHPNIVTIHDLIQHDGLDMIVMEFLDGKSLAEMLREKEIPQAVILKLAIEVAGALARAHSAGIVHRDLKPANILITKDGLAKVVDFGIAKLGGDKAEDNTATHSTERGTIVGTAAYMSPEQAQGAPVDARSDIFSFGSVLYEMLTGRGAFDRGSMFATLSAVVRDEPELMSSLPASLAPVVVRCLRKDPARRFQTMGTLRVELEDVRDNPAAAEPPPATPARSRSLLASAAVAALCLLLGSVAAYRFAVPRWSLGVMSPLVAEPGVSKSPVWSPDGQMLAYVRNSGDSHDLMIRAKDAQVSNALVSARGALSNLQWAADSARLYYLEGGQLWSAGLASGAPRRLGNGLRAFAVAPDGVTFAVLDAAGNALRIGPLDAANPVAVQPPFEKLSARPGSVSLSFSPDGARLLASFAQPDRSGVGDPSETSVFVVDRAGKTARIATGTGAAANARWMADGRHIVFQDSTGGNAHLVLLDSKTGRTAALSGSSLAEESPSMHPDGASLAFESVRTEQDLIEFPLDGAPQKSLLASSRAEHSAAWSPDGQNYAYVRGIGRASEIWLRHAAEDRVRLLLDTASPGLPPGTVSLRGLRFSPGGRSLAFVAFAGRPSLHVLSLAGGKPVALDAGEQGQHSPAWSADGKWIAYVRGDRLVKVSSGGGEPSVIASGVGNAVDWSATGEIAYCALEGGYRIIDASGKLVAPVEAEGACAPGGIAFSHDGRRVYYLAGGALFEADSRTGKTRRRFDAAAPARLSELAMHPSAGRLLATSTLMRSDIWRLDEFPTAVPGLSRWLPWFLRKF